MDEVSTRSARGILALLGVKGLGPATLSKVTAAFDTLGSVAAAGDEGLKGHASAPVRAALAGPALGEALAAADRTLAYVAEMGGGAVSCFDGTYPFRLLPLNDRPPVVFYQGDLSCLDKSVACVGTREPTRYGEAVSSRVSAMLASAGWTVVSGLARGVDRICHRAAVEAGGRTAAVLGCGFAAMPSDPARALAEEIVASGGLVLTEHHPTREADPSSLIRRNRVITGVSAATFFLQGALDGGSMHSVRYAVVQGRPVFAPMVPAAFADEPLNQAAACMTGMRPSEFLSLIEAKDSFAEAVARLGRPTLALPFAGRDDYPAVLAELDGLLEPAAGGPPSP